MLLYAFKVPGRTAIASMMFILALPTYSCMLPTGSLYFMHAIICCNNFDLLCRHKNAVLLCCCIVAVYFRFLMAHGSAFMTSMYGNNLTKKTDIHEMHDKGETWKMWCFLCCCFDYNRQFVILIFLPSENIRRLYTFSRSNRLEAMSEILGNPMINASTTRKDRLFNNFFPSEN